MEGPVIVTLLGLVAGAACRFVFRRFWIASLVATLTTSALWVGGVSLFLAIAAPNELRGPIAWIQILLTVVNALIAAVIGAGAVRATRAFFPAVDRRAA